MGEQSVLLLVRFIICSAFLCTFSISFSLATKINGLHAYYEGKNVNFKTAAKVPESGFDQRDNGTNFKIGFGIGDITGPSAEINMVSGQILLLAIYFSFVFVDGLCQARRRYDWHSHEALLSSNDCS